MIVELTGIPGAGKSTVLESLKALEKNPHFVFNIRDYIMGKSFLPLRGKVGYDLVLLGHIYILGSEEWQVLKYAFSYVKRSSNSFFHKMNILRNILKKLIIHRYIEDRDEVFFIDEGISHIPFNIFVDVGDVLNNEEVKVFLKLLPSVDRVLTIDAPDELLFERVVARGSEGHRRIDFNSNEKVVHFMQQSREVLELLKMHFNGYIYHNIEKEIDRETIINQLGLENV